MASIVKRPNGKWRARYRDQAGREHARHFDRKVDASRWLDEVTAALVVGQYVDPRASKITFQAYAETWLASQVHREQTGVGYESRLRLHVYPRIGRMQLGTIRQSTIQSLVKQISADLAPSSVQLVYKIVGSVFRAAVRDRRIPESPCLQIRLPEVHKPRVRPLSLEQLQVLRATVPAELEALVVLVAGTGLRQGEALGLTRDRLRMLGKSPQVTVDRQMVTHIGGADFGPLKTKASYRTVPLPEVVIRALNAHIARYGVAEDGLLFTLQGEPITRSRFGHAFAAARDAATLTAATGTGVHALRHYYASLLIRHGESVKVVQARLGHRSATETLDTYSHLWPDSDDLTRAAVDDVLLHPLADSVRTAESG